MFEQDITFIDAFDYMEHLHELIEPTENSFSNETTPEDLEIDLIDNSEYGRYFNLEDFLLSQGVGMTYEPSKSI